MAAVQERSGRRSQVEEFQPRILLQPIAAPSVLGYFGLCSSLLIYGTYIAGSWGQASSPEYFFFFVAAFGGIGQLGAALWSYSARDATAASNHGAWGALWLGWGVMWLMATAGLITIPAIGTHFAPFGMWMIYMGVITLTTAFAALARSPGIALALLVLTAATAIDASALLYGSPGLTHWAGWLFVAAAAAVFYVGAALMIDNVYGFTALPLLRWRRQGPAEPAAVWEHGDPGVKVGQ
jgi:succinate-acetate transporter protein